MLHGVWTWNGPDHADVYRLELDPDDPEKYIFDGESIPFERTDTTYRLPDGETREETLLASVHGPVTHVNQEKGYAVAYRLSAHGQADNGPQYLQMLRARNLQELNTAMGSLQVCHFNQIAVDTEGHIQYLWGGRVPIRREGVNFRRPMDGSTSKTLWEINDVVPLSQMPQVRDPECGFVQNCNNSPSMTTGTDADPQPEEAPDGVGGGTKDTVRSWYLKQQLSVEDKLSIDDGRNVATDAYMIPHGPMSRILAHSWETYGEAYERQDEIAENIQLILDWDGSPSLNSWAPSIFTMWLWKAFNETIMLPVSLMETPLTDIDEKFARKLFEGMIAAQDELRSLIPLPRVPWGMMHHIRRENRVWPVETGMYPAISLMNANIATRGKKLEDLNCVIGSAYVAFHVIDKDGIRTESIMPLGQTDDLDKAYVDSMTDLFARRELKPLPFTDEEMAEVEMTETVLQIERPLRGKEVIPD